MRIFASYHRGEALRFLAHLDAQRLFQRALRRGGIPVAYSQGFNPHPILSFAFSLPVGYTADGEWIDLRLEEDMEPEEFIARMNGSLPAGYRIETALAVPETLPTLTALVAGVRYRVALELPAPMTAAGLQEAVDGLLSGPIVVRKKTKGGMRDVDIRPLVNEVRAEADGLFIDGVLNVDGGLSAELFMQALTERAGISAVWRVHRAGLYFNDTFSLLPQKDRG